MVLCRSQACLGSSGLPQDIMLHILNLASPLTPCKIAMSYEYPSTN